MRLTLLTIIFLLVLSSKAQTPWVENNAEWRYYYEETTLAGITGIYLVTKTGNVLKNGVLCDELVWTDNQYNHIDDTLYQTSIIDTVYTYLSATGDSVMYWQNGAFRTLYDFSLTVGDSSVLHVNDVQLQFCNDTAYSRVIETSTINVQGNLYRKLVLNHPLANRYTLGEYYAGYSPGINERFGAAPEFNEDAFLFPIENRNCGAGLYLNFTLLCFSDDSLFYEWDCDYNGSVSVKEHEMSLNSSIIFPNPFTDYLEIKTEQPLRILILDGLGRKVYSKNYIPNQKIDLSHLSIGTYHVFYYLKNKLITRNLIVKI